MKPFHDLLIHSSTMAGLVSYSLLRLLVAAVLGGIIGLERELRHKPAGLRTQMFICFGSAFFTVLSGELAGGLGGDHTRIAAQIIPGIGFIGAGSILHSRGSVSGLTTAASLFVVASIGMAAGGGLYFLALFATVLLLVSLVLLGLVEARFSLKPLTVMYEVAGPNLEEVLNAVDGVLAEQQHVMQTVHISRRGPAAHVQFTVCAARNEQEALMQQLRQTPEVHNVQNLGPVERE
jgi:putative Mg2+ transporter-C (MgtC) family protein